MGLRAIADNRQGKPRRVSESEPPYERLVTPTPRYGDLRPGWAGGEDCCGVACRRRPLVGPWTVSAAPVFQIGRTRLEADEIATRGGQGTGVSGRASGAPTSPGDGCWSTRPSSVLRAPWLSDDCTDHHSLVGARPEVHAIGQCHRRSSSSPEDRIAMASLRLGTPVQTSRRGELGAPLARDDPRAPACELSAARCGKSATR